MFYCILQGNRAVIFFYQIQEIADNSNTWLLFMETTDPERGSMKLPRFHKDGLYISKYTLYIQIFLNMLLC